MSRRDDRYVPSSRHRNHSHNRHYSHSHYDHRGSGIGDHYEPTGSQSYRSSRHSRNTRDEQVASDLPLPSVEAVAKEYKRQGHFDHVRRALLDDFKQSRLYRILQKDVQRLCRDATSDITPVDYFDRPRLERRITMDMETRLPILEEISSKYRDVLLNDKQYVDTMRKHMESIASSLQKSSSSIPTKSEKKDEKSSNLINEILNLSYLPKKAPSNSNLQTLSESSYSNKSADTQAQTNESTAVKVESSNSEANSLKQDKESETKKFPEKAIAIQEDPASEQLNSKSDLPNMNGTNTKIDEEVQDINEEKNGMNGKESRGIVKAEMENDNDIDDKTLLEKIPVEDEKSESSSSEQSDTRPTPVAKRRRGRLSKKADEEPSKKRQKKRNPSHNLPEQEPENSYIQIFRRGEKLAAYIPEESAYYVVLIKSFNSRNGLYTIRANDPSVNVQWDVQIDELIQFNHTEKSFVVGQYVYALKQRRTGSGSGRFYKAKVVSCSNKVVQVSYDVEECKQESARSHESSRTSSNDGDRCVLKLNQVFADPESQ